MAARPWSRLGVRTEQGFAPRNLVGGPPGMQHSRSLQAQRRSRRLKLDVRPGEGSPRGGPNTECRP
eukprot:6095423-Amphidinium_carterae.1